MRYSGTMLYASLLLLSAAAGPVSAAPQKTSPAESARRDHFAAMDTNRDGAVSRDEWTGSEEGFKRRDSDNSGSLDRYEFYQELVPGNLE